MAAGIELPSLTEVIRDYAASQRAVYHEDWAVTSGDSDSIACLTGAFAGAHLSAGRWPQEWVHRIEYGDRLSLLAGKLSEGINAFPRRRR